MAKLTFYGATEGVTGSLYLLETASGAILLECGLVQGRNEEEKANAEPFPFDIKSIDAVVLSHAHLDHSGRLPKLVKDGYKGPVYVTHATLDLLEILLKDAAFLNMRDVEWENRRRRRSAKNEINVLYDIDDVENALLLCDSNGYGESREILKGVTLTYFDAGHILGSSVVQITIKENDHTAKLVFSGDLGNNCAALMRDPAKLSDADVLLLESTYGDRNHRSHEETLQEFRDIIIESSKSGGNILIPSFAVGRTQEIIFRLGELYQEGKLRHQEVYLDSPMAIATTEVYHRYQQSFNVDDKQAMRDAKSRTLHSFLPILRYSKSTEESMAINKITDGAIIIAGSGMCNGGRIRHHLKHNLWRKNCHVLIVGYQAIGTPGRTLVDGAEFLRIGGEEISIKATIHTLGGFSAHAGQSQLIEWAEGFKNSKPDVYLVHGESIAKQTLQKKLQTSGMKVEIAQTGKTIEI